MKHPRLDWATEQEAVKQSFGVLIGMLVGWAILIGLAIISYFLITWGLNMYLYAAVICAILLICCAILFRHLMKTAENYYGEINKAPAAAKAAKAVN